MTNIQKKRLQFIKDAGGKCLLCEETRGLQLAHIVPRRCVEGIDELVAWHKDNIAVLCPTHHYCYDHWLLTQEEAQKLLSIYLPVIPGIIKAVIEMKPINAKGEVAPKEHYSWKQLNYQHNELEKWWTRTKRMSLTPSGQSL